MGRNVEGFSVASNSFKEGRTDYSKLLLGLSLEPGAYSLKRYEAAQVERCVAFILSPKLVGYLSWGTKYLYVDENRYPFPRLKKISSLKDF